MGPSWIQHNQYIGGNEVQLLRSGRPFFEAVHACIQKATQTLHVQMYILSADETGQQVLRLLLEAAASGVRVFILADAYGSLYLDKSWQETLQQAGVQFRFFGNAFWQKRSIGRRLHHKIIVADNREFILGGLNIANRYNDLPGMPAWLDYAVWVRGPIAQHAQLRCTQLWNKKRWPRLRARQEPNPTPVLVRLSANDWLRGNHEINERLRQAIRHAHQEVLIAAAYFVPTGRILYELKKAARRGVSVRLLFGKYSDVGLALHATRFLYDLLFRSGMHVYEFQKGVLHAKVLLVDSQWASIGSYNLNYLSAFESLELNIDIADASFGKQLRLELESVIERDSEKINPVDYFQKLRVGDRIVNSFSFVLIWVITGLLVFLHRRTERPG